MKNLTVNAIVKRALISAETLYSDNVIAFAKKNPNNILNMLNEHQQELLEDIHASLTNAGMLLSQQEVIELYLIDMEAKKDAETSGEGGVQACFMSDLSYRPSGMVMKFQGYQVTNIEDMLREALTRLLLMQGEITLTP